MERPPWLLDELSHAGDEHLDPVYVSAYDDKAQTDPGADLAVLRKLGLDRTRTLMDFGAGTGTFALSAAQVCKHVVAVDVSAPMLERLNERARRQGLANVTCVRSGLLTYEHEGNPADFAYSRNTLHHLPDFWKATALRRVADALRPGGVFYLRDIAFSFGPEEAERVIESWLADAPERPESGFTASDLAKHVREEYSTYTWLLEPMLAQAGFQIQNAEFSANRVFAAYTCTKR